MERYIPGPAGPCLCKVFPIPAHLSVYRTQDGLAYQFMDGEMNGGDTRVCLICEYDHDGRVLRHEIVFYEENYVL
jgi:hypothetical protein